MDMLFPGPMKMAMKTTRAQFGIATSRTSQTGEMTQPVSGRRPVLALLMRLLCAAALALPAAGAQASAALTSLHSFGVFTNGANPYAGLVQGGDGSFYGTTVGGGTNGGYGTVFRISATGTLTSLYSFTGKDGANPHGGLVQGSDGDFYGTTTRGGANNSGSVFKINPKGALTSLYSFTGGIDGACPWAGLVQGSDGNFYGTTYYGGTSGFGSRGNGTVFKISTNGALNSLHSLTGSNDGGRPDAGLVQGSGGYFYGTTRSGGTKGGGTVFRISANGALTSLYSFTGGSDGGCVRAGLVKGSDGYLYGTTYIGGRNSAYGTVFKTSPKGR
jgi:uncharacterized repeat protein (TIGR03803 family)